MKLINLFKIPFLSFNLIKYLYDGYLKSIKKVYSSKQFVSFGINSIIENDVSISHPSRVSIGNESLIQSRVIINSAGGLHIGSHVRIGLNSYIITFSHNYLKSNMIPYDKKNILKPVIIRDFVWIGWGSIILPGVEIGEGAIIGAGSVVNNNIPAYSVVSGNPAKIVSYRNKDNFINCKNNNKLLNLEDERSGNFSEEIPKYFTNRYYDELKLLNMI